MEEKIRLQIERRDFLSQWGFNNYVISYRVKVRMMEDLIDKAQRLRQQPNKVLEDEVSRLKILRDQTFEDLHDFVKQREKNPWRNWDKWRVINKQKIQYVDIQSENALKAAIQQEFIEIGKATRILTVLEEDYRIVLQTNNSMLTFVKSENGGEGWVRLH